MTVMTQMIVIVMVEEYHVMVSYLICNSLIHITFYLHLPSVHFIKYLY